MLERIRLEIISEKQTLLYVFPFGQFDLVVIVDLTFVLKNVLCKKKNKVIASSKK